MPTMGKGRSAPRLPFGYEVGADLAAARADERFGDLGATGFFMVRSHGSALDRNRLSHPEDFQRSLPNI
jgi:hypothetical protein